MIGVMDYDVIVIGAGPAGSSAAMAAAKQGAKVILLEEHAVVGIPAHCNGGFLSTARPDLMEEIISTMDKRVVIQKRDAGSEMRVIAPSGKIVQTSKQPSVTYLVDRAAFDYELARQAVNAGAQLFLNTRVTSLVKQNGRVVGVNTSSTKMPQIFGKVVIAADGISGGVRGVAKWEGLIREGQKYVTGITMELAGVKDCERVHELYTGSYLTKGWTGISPSGIDSWTTHFLTYDEFERIKFGNCLLSRKLKDAVPIKIVGWKHTSNLGVRFPEIVKEGLILTGSAANWRGNLVAVISGRYAGEVAAEAAREGDVSVGKLSQFIDLYEKTGLLKERYQHSDFMGARPFAQLSDEEIEEFLQELIQKYGFTYIPSAPVTGLHGRVD
jgi:digeranylgeranylglycerophospholipid reductase